MTFASEHGEMMGDNWLAKITEEMGKQTSGILQNVDVKVGQAHWMR